MHKSELVIKEPNKPFINKVIVSFLYTCLFGYTIYLFAYRDFWNHPEKWTVIIFLVILLFILFSSSFMSIASHSIHLNFKEQKIQHQYSVGIFKYKEVWQDIIEPEYISVFKKDNYYLVNLWYEKNAILNLMAIEDSGKAIENGLLIAEKLSIDLLDARKRGYHKWVDKKAFKTSGKVTYLT